MVDKNILLHPYKSDGTQDEDTNLYPKTKAENVDGLPEGDTDIEFVGDSNNVLQEVMVGDETFTVPQGSAITVDQTYNPQSTNPQSGTAVAGAISTKQNTIDSSHKLSADLVQDGTTNKVVTATEKSTWNGKQNALNATQMNAVNSGVTSGKVATYDGYSSGKINVKPDGTNNLIVNNKINTAYLPDTLLGALHFVSSFDASNGDEPSSGTHELQAGDYFIATVAGNYNPMGTQTGIEYQIGDWAIYVFDEESGEYVWQKVDNTDAVTMVNDQIGSVHTYKGTWTVSTTYYAGDFVKDSNNVVYLCIQTGTNIALTNIAYWYSFDIPTGDTDIEFVDDGNGNLAEINVGNETFTVPTGAYKITAVTETADSINITLEAV